MITVQQAVVRYPRFTLGPLHLTLHAGERVALVGRNGTGKSTLLALMAGQRHADEGTVHFGSPIAGTYDAAEARLHLRRHVAYVGAGLQALPWYTVRRHFDFLGRMHARWHPGRAMELARALHLDPDAVTGTLSRGNLVKLNLCAAWGQEATVLLLDEPTAGLDPVARDDLLLELRRFLERHAHASVVYATHLLDELVEVAPSRLLVLRDGTLREYASDATGGFDVATMRQLMLGDRVAVPPAEVA